MSPRSRVYVSKPVSVVHCIDCEWQPKTAATKYSDTQRLARDHARRHHHRVIVHRTVEYDFREHARRSAKGGAR